MLARALLGPPVRHYHASRVLSNQARWSGRGKTSGRKPPPPRPVVKGGSRRRLADVRSSTEFKPEGERNRWDKRRSEFGHSPHMTGKPSQWKVRKQEERARDKKGEVQQVASDVKWREYSQASADAENSAKTRALNHASHSRPSTFRTDWPDRSDRSDRYRSRSTAPTWTAPSRDDIPRAKPSSNPTTYSRTPRVRVPQPLMDNPEAPALGEAPTQEKRHFFRSPPLLDGLLTSLRKLLDNSEPKPTAIQQLSLAYFFNRREGESSTDSEVASLVPHVNLVDGTRQGLETLLAAQTGSGKSIAYLLPVLQALKASEYRRAGDQSSRRLMQPRALILSPTHELSRQISMFTKSLTHGIKLRTLCLSKPNKGAISAKSMSDAVDASSSVDGEFVIKAGTEMHEAAPKAIDILVGTPARFLELVRGRAWEKEDENGEKIPWDGVPKGPANRPDWKPELGLEHIEWVVIDEADILFDRDFLDFTEGLLADIQKAQGERKFNTIFCSATIPNSLDLYLKEKHPNHVRLADPKLHQLPANLKAEVISAGGSNRLGELAQRINQAWADEAMDHIRHGGTAKSVTKSKVLIFCNKTSAVDETAKYLAEKGIEAIPMTKDGDLRKRGHDHHLLPFLKRTKRTSADIDPTLGARVLISTSMLSRGLDFASDIKHVYILDEPRNMIDFIHRAGRSGRAGNEGNVVVFSKEKSRGATVSKEVRKRIGAVRGQN